MGKFNKTTLVLSVLVLSMSIKSHSQEIRTAYFMKSTHTRSQLNPAFRPPQGYLGLPVISNLGAETSTNFLTFDNLNIKQGTETISIFDENVDYAEAIKRFPDQSKGAVNLNVDLFSLGFYSKDGKGFWSVNVSSKLSAATTIPKSVLEMAKFNSDILNGASNSFSIKNMNLRATAFTEFGLGYSRSLMDDKLTLGGRAKFIGGHGDINMEVNEISANVSRSGGETTINAISQMGINGSAPGLKAKYNDDGEFDGFDISGAGLTGFGMGFDLGAEYDMRDYVPGLRVSAAVTDLGFIAWSKKHSVALAPRVSQVSGTISDYPTDQSSFDAIKQTIEDLGRVSELEEISSKSRSTSLYPTINIGAEYGFMMDKLSVGALYSRRSHDFFATNELTLSFNTRPAKWFAASVSYSMLNNKAFDAVGLALHFAPSKGLNLFIATDYALPKFKDSLPQKSDLLNAQIGITIPIGARR